MRKIDCTELAIRSIISNIYFIEYVSQTNNTNVLRYEEQKSQYYSHILT